jgi:hypothetical protein
MQKLPSIADCEKRGSDDTLSVGFKDWTIGMITSVRIFSLRKKEEIIFFSFFVNIDVSPFR